MTKNQNNPEDSETGILHTKRRPLLLVGGSIAIAGCASDDEEQPEEDTQTASIESDDETADQTRNINVAEIVAAHKSAVKNENYVADITLQREDSSESFTHSVVYEQEYTTSGKQVTIIEESTKDNDIDSITQRYDGETQEVEVTFDSGETESGDVDFNEETIDEEYPVTITGGSIVKQLLTGSTLSENEVPENQKKTVGEYEITKHEELKRPSGTIVVGENQLIKKFELEWETENKTKRRVDMELIY